MFPVRCTQTHTIKHITAQDAVQMGRLRAAQSYAAVLDMTAWNQFTHPLIASQKYDEFKTDYSLKGARPKLIGKTLLQWWNGKVLYRLGCDKFMIYDGLSFIPQDQQSFANKLGDGLEAMWKHNLERIKADGCDDSKLFKVSFDLYSDAIFLALGQYIITYLSNFYLYNTVLTFVLCVITIVDERLDWSCKSYNKLYQDYRISQR